MNKTNTAAKHVLLLALKLLAGIAVTAGCLFLLMGLLAGLLLNGPAESDGNAQSYDRLLMDRFDMFMTNQRSDALDGVLDVKKVYWLNDEDITAPEPDQSKFGSTTDPSTLQWLLDEAAGLLEGQELLFRTDVEIMPGSEVQYYLDETILSICWKQGIDGACYSFNEVKIAHPSQFRRFLADGKYGSPFQYITTRMSATVNAVSACNGDFYKYRSMGIVVYNGQVYRSENTPDVCFIDDKGDMHMFKGKTFKSKAQVQEYVEENNIRFSLSFGPMLVDDHQLVVPDGYMLGEMHTPYSRAALAQMDDLHYLTAVTSFEGDQRRMPTIKKFANVLHGLGVKNAYALDGGQTALIVMNDKRFSVPNFNSQRHVSDMIYFATAVPDGG